VSRLRKQASINSGEQSAAKSDPAGKTEAAKRVLRARVNRATELDLSDLDILELPPELSRCANLKSLKASGNRLQRIPNLLGGLSKLQTLILGNNEISSVAEEVRSLQRLEVLDLSNNRLTSFPKALTTLKKLRVIDASNNKLTRIEGAEEDLPAVTTLDLSRNELETLPTWIFRTGALRDLFLAGNELQQLSEEIRSAKQLELLDLSYNGLKTLPSQIEYLTALKSLSLRGNQIITLPPELGKLRGLAELAVDQAGLISPPADVVAQGLNGVMAYLRSLLDENAPIYPHQVKLVLVGQGDVGKTCLVNNLLVIPIKEHQGKTEGVEIRQLQLPHPEDSRQNMTLAIWDFGGQEIQHATHQFFLTNRSLFVLLWNARQDVGKRGGNVQYWLEMIKSRAPDSPVFMVATHCDQEPARVSTEYWRNHFPNIRGVYEIGNLNNKGVEELKEALRQEASKLPIMKDAWNRRWMEARKAVKEIDKAYITPEEAWGVMRSKGVETEELEVVAGRMHLLGDIVYFRENVSLKDTIILDPSWLTKRVCEAVSSDLVQKKSGVLSRELLEHIWPTEKHAIRDELLNFMEQYDLSYRTDSHRDESIVVQALPDSPPDELSEEWNKTNRKKSLDLRYKFKGTLPPGIPSWFIAREHRFTMGLHWRYGAVFKDRGGQHRALVQLTDTAGDLNVLLSVRGEEPIKFFSILQDGLEETLSRYPGLNVQRMVPCPGDLCGGSCDHEFGLETLEKYRLAGKPLIVCGGSLEEYDVMSLLYGIEIPNSDPSVARFDEMLSQLHKINDNVEVVSAEVRHVGEMIGFQQRQFTKLFQSLQSQALTHCPSVFFVVQPQDGWTKRFLTNKAQIQLCCEMPGNWHSVENDGRYDIADPAHWLSRVAPYLRILVKVLKVASPSVVAALELASPDLGKEFAANLKLAQELPKLIPDLALDDEMKGDQESQTKVAGVAFQALREALVGQDPNLVRTGLTKMLMPEGNYLWLCPQHLEEAMRLSR
jgi:internalin A